MSSGTYITTINARDLHIIPKVIHDFSNGIKPQIVKAHLDEERDYVKLTELSEPSGQTLIQYFLAIDAAKHVAMMSNTETPPCEHLTPRLHIPPVGGFYRLLISAERLAGL